MRPDGRTGGVLLRRADPGDIAALAKLERACFSDPWSERLLEETLAGPYDEVWILEAGVSGSGECHACPIAYADFRFLADEGELMRIAVMPGSRRRGYARKLMERLEKSAAERGTSSLMLEVREGNAAARSLYGSCGFSGIAVRKNYYRDPDENAIVMKRCDLLGITT